MDPSHRLRRPSSRRVACLCAIALLVFGAAACTDDGSDDADGPTTTTAPASPAPGPAATPKPTLTAAVEALLSAEQAGDHAASYRLLDRASRKRIGDQADWADLRSEQPPVTGFEVAPEGRNRVVATVRHDAGLDPFIGLAAGEERQVWTGERTAGGWLVDGAPEVEPQRPPERDAREAAKHWAEAVQDCDQELARLAQGLDELHGTSEGATQLCGSTGEVTVGAVGRLETGPTSAELVAQYTDAALDWARVVPVEGPTDPFLVVLAPIGDRWLVVGTSD